MFFRLKQVVFCVLAAVILTAAAMPIPVLDESFDGKSFGKGSQIRYVSGRTGKGVHFSVNRHSSIKYDGKKINANEGSISIWVKPDLPLRRGNVRTILNIGGPAKELQGVNFSIDNNALVVPGLRVSELNWKNNSWNHIVYTWKPDRQDKNFPFRYEIAVYINGRGMAKRIVNARPVPASVITLGAYPVPEYGRPQLFELEGTLDDFKLFDKCLSLKEIAVLSAVRQATPAPAEKPFVLPSAKGVVPFVLEGNNGTLTLDKKTYIEIILPAKPTTAETAAAYDLRTHLLEITRGRITVRKNLTPQKGFRIFIGSVSGIKKTWKQDEILIRIDQDKCLLAGHPEYGALNAVYTLLEHIGFRWFDTTGEGRFVPQTKEITLPRGEWQYVPCFAMRRIQLATPYDYKKNLKVRDLDEWGRRNKLHLGRYDRFHKMVAPHLDKIIPENVFLQHPEYFGMDDSGKRDIPARNKINPCTSNPQVVQLIQQKAIELLKKNPWAQYFSIEPIDGGGWCLCQNCRKLDAAPENYTDRVITLANQITQAIEKAFPGQNKAARFFAYQGYVNLPVRTKAKGNLQVEVTRGAPELVAGWAKYVQNLQRWDYNGWFSFKWGPMPLSVMPQKIAQAKKYHYSGGYFDEGVASVLSLGQPFYYIEAKLMWNPDYDLKLLLDDFFSKYYGPAAKPMRRCFDLIEKETLKNKSSDDMFTEYNRNIFQPYIYSPVLWKKCLSFCDEAEKLAAGKPVILRRIKQTRLTYLLADTARDALIAKQYLTEKNHPFHNYIRQRKEINTQNLLSAVKLARELGIEKVRGNCEPGNFEAIIAAWAYPLQIDIAPFYELLYPQTAPKKSAAVKKGPWKKVFEDKFDRKTLGQNWKVIHGSWKIENGVLSGRGDALYINKKFPGDQKLCFDAWVSKSGTACDLDGILADKTMARYGNSGYLFAFGTYGNNFSKINREKVQILRIADPVIIPGKVHKIVCEKSGNILTWSIDGKLVAQYKEGFRTLDGEYIGLYTDAGGFFDNIEVYTR